MDIPITEKEFKIIIEILKNSNQKDLYNKLWTFNINRKNKLWIS
jgi:hypothetical protein